MATITPIASYVQEEAAPATGEAAPPTGLNPLIPAVLIAAIFYFVLIRPEKNKQKQREALLKSIKKGDKVMTSSGLFGNVADIREEVVTLIVAEGVRLKFNRAAIQTVIDPKEDLEKKDA